MLSCACAFVEERAVAEGTRGLSGVRRASSIPAGWKAS